MEFQWHVTNGIPMARKFETYQPYLQRWYELGLSTILISTVSNRPEINGEVYTPRTKQYIDLPQLIANLHEIGFSVRLTAVCTKAWMSTPEQIDEYLQFAKENAVEQVTLRPLNDEYRRETAQAWINEHKMSEEDKENIYNFLNENEIIETTKMISTYRVDLNYQDFADDDFDDDDFDDDCLLNADWEHKELRPISSYGYSIIDKETGRKLTDIYNLDDIREFITEEMDEYLKD